MSKPTFPVSDLPRRVDVHVEPRAAHELSATPRASAPSMARARRLRRLTGRLSALLADDRMSERFVAERRRDEDVIRRVEGRRRQERD